MKKVLILKDKTINIKTHEDYIEFTNDNKEFIAAYKYISEVYINKHITVSIEDVLKIAKKIPLFFVDHNGYIIAKVSADV
ncbi:MAG: hypothetical protein IBX44_00845 [Sulfurospirillum sp.]|nr:hypothetical protein [Sulfurospirillum sp.]